jgi:hypothetical protein
MKNVPTVNVKIPIMDVVMIIPPLKLIKKEQTVKKEMDPLKSLDVNLPNSDVVQMESIHKTLQWVMDVVNMPHLSDVAKIT